MAVLSLHWSLDIALVFFFSLVAAYLYMTRNFNYWSKRGVTEVRPVPFFGNLLDCCLLRRTTGETFKSMYKWGKDLPYLGIHFFDKPILLLRDPEIIKFVLIKHFNSFQNRHIRTHEGDPIAYANMFLLENPLWTTVRHSVSPIFSSGKSRGMFPLMLEIGKNLVTHLDSLELQGDGRVVEVKDISARFTTDVITSCAFGLEVDSLNDPESLFRRCGTSIFGFATYKRSAELAAFFFAPSVAKFLQFQFFEATASDFMRKILTDTIALRLETNVHRNDLIDLLISIKKSQSQIEHPNGFVLDGDNLIAQAATFFAAGFETSATTMAFTLYELALQPKLQTRLREEILAALDDTGGEITYEMVMTLPYLDMVMSESLRKYPTLPFLDRMATCDYEVPGTGLVIERGTPVLISLLGLQYDPKYFPDPDHYDPERFTKENKKKLPSCVYLPFGEGPRNCIGFRFGQLQSKLGIMKFILDHEVTTCAETPIPMSFDPKGILLKSNDGIYLNVRKL